MANEANDVNGANKADAPTIHQSRKTNKAEANDANNEANKTEANEAGAEANEANEAIVANETKKANEPLIRPGQQVDEANNATTNEPLIRRDQQVEEAVVVDNDNGTANASEDKAYFGIHVDVCNNKLLMVRSRDELDKLVEVEGANNNQL